MRSLVVLILGFAFAACATDSVVELVSVPGPVGDQSIFAQHEMRAEISFYDTRAPNNSDAQLRRVYLAVYPDDIEGLKMFVNGVEAGISSSAALPPSYFFVYDSDDYDDRSLLVEFRKAGASFFVGIVPVVGQVSAPLENPIHASEPSFTLKWSGSIPDAPEVNVQTTHRSENTVGACTVRYVSESQRPTEAVLANQEAQNDVGSGPPCELIASVDWQDQLELTTPFKSFTLSRYATAALKTEIR